MRSCVLGIIAIGLLGPTAQPQSPQFPSYKNQEEYCRANPKNVLCSVPGYREGKPLDLTGKGLGVIDMKGLGVTSRPVTTAAHRPRMDAVPVVAPGGNVDWRFAHTNPAMLMSLNLRALMTSPVMESVFSQISSQLGGQLPGVNPAEFAKARSFMNNIDRVYLSARPTGPNPEILVLMTGRFDDAFLTAMQLSATERTKFANATAILIGDPSSLAQATRRMAANTAPGPVVQNAGAWAAQYDLWITGNPSMFPASAGASKTGGLPDFASSVRSFSVGMKISSDVRMDAVLVTASAQIAEQLAGLVRSGALKQPGMDQFGRAMQVTTNGATVQISASIDGAQISRGMSARTAAGRRGSTITSPVTTGAVPITEGQSNPNAKPGRVVISGLDGGPKEISTEVKK